MKWVKIIYKMGFIRLKILNDQFYSFIWSLISQCLLKSIFRQFIDILRVGRLGKCFYFFWQKRSKSTHNFHHLSAKNKLEKNKLRSKNEKGSQVQNLFNQKHPTPLGWKYNEKVIEIRLLNRELSHSTSLVLDLKTKPNLN